MLATIEQRGKFEPNQDVEFFNRTAKLSSKKFLQCTTKKVTKFQPRRTLNKLLKFL